MRRSRDISYFIKNTGYRTFAMQANMRRPISIHSACLEPVRLLTQTGMLKGIAETALQWRSSWLGSRSPFHIRPNIRIDETTVHTCERDYCQPGIELQRYPLCTLFAAYRFFSYRHPPDCWLTLTYGRARVPGQSALDEWDATRVALWAPRKRSTIVDRAHPLIIKGQCSRHRPGQSRR